MPKVGLNKRSKGITRQRPTIPRFVGTEPEPEPEIPEPPKRIIRTKEIEGEMICEKYNMREERKASQSEGGMGDFVRKIEGERVKHLLSEIYHYRINIPGEWTPEIMEKQAQELVNLELGLDKYPLFNLSARLV